MEDFELLEHIGELKHTGTQLIAQGYSINTSMEIENWPYIIDRIIICKSSTSFMSDVSTVYLQTIEDNEPGYAPTVHEVADAIDEINMLTIYNYYRSYGYPDDMIDIFVANYIQEFSCIMEDWVMDALTQMGYPYSGTSVVDFDRLRRDSEPMNILLIQFLL